MSYIAQYSSECLHMDKTIAKKKKVRQRKTLLILSTTVSTEEKRKKENQARIFNVFDSSVIWATQNCYFKGIHIKKNNKIKKRFIKNEK